MPSAADILNALLVNLLLIGVYAGLPALFLMLKGRRPPTAEALWTAAGALAAFQALFGTLLSRSLPGMPPAGNLLLLPLFAWAASGLARAATPPLPPRGQRDFWLPLILLLAFTVRILSPLQEAALGQSDAYSHLQFLRDMVQSGRVRNPIYPAGHARVSAPVLWLTGLDLYTFARYAGATYGLGLVLGVYSFTRHLRDARAARIAALLAAGFPLAGPLIRTGIGLFANQLGLMLLPLLLYSLSRLADAPPADRWKSVTALLLYPAALFASVPMMLLDLLPALLVFLLLWTRGKIRLACVLAAGAGGLVLIGIIISRLPILNFQHLVNMLTEQSRPPTGYAAAFGQLVQDYLRWNPPPAPLLFRLAVGAAGIAALGLPFLPGAGRGQTLLGVCTGFSALQTATGVLQFSAYLRAGWFFLLCVCCLTGLLLSWFPSFPRLMLLSRRALIPVCMVPLLLPPGHHPHMSPMEESLIRQLRLIRLHRSPCEAPGFQFVSKADAVPPPSDVHLAHVWTRGFTRFAGAQGDPVPALLEDLPCLRLHRLLPGDPPPDFPPGLHWVLLDPAPHRPTGNAHFDAEVRLLQEANHTLKTALEALAETHPESLTLLVETPGFEVWEVRR